MQIFHRILPVALILLWSCHSEEFKPLDYGRDFAPLRKGLYHIYNVEETIYSETSPVQNNSYQIKVALIDSFQNVEGSYTYVLSRFKRSDSNAAWADAGTWSSRIADNELIVNEGNVSFVRLVFPVRVDAEWNGNKFNSLAEDDFKVQDYDQPLTVGGIIFDKTSTVVEEDNEDFISFYDERKSIYARDVGLIARYSTQLKYCTDDNCIRQQKIKSGTIYKQEISEYGYQ